MYVAEWSEKSFGEAMIPESRTSISSGTITGSRRAVFLVGRVITLCREFMSITSFKIIYIIIYEVFIKVPNKNDIFRRFKGNFNISMEGLKKWTSEVRGL